MTRLPKKGITTPLSEGLEHYMEFIFFDSPSESFCQYDDMDVDGKLFFCMKPTLEECRKARDKWIKNKRSNK